ncbi:MAG: S-methyl-5'-thioadenosine phosphorylase [Candidatus Omnitrophota bacterium]
MGKIGIIGGSGLYDIEGLENRQWLDVKTPYGAPSDKFLLAKLGEREVVFLPRHARGHKINPSQINYRANIWGMKSLDVTHIISVTACGSLKEEIRPLDFIIPLQFVDRTNKARINTFFDEGIVVHVSFAQPVCSELACIMHTAVKNMGIRVHYGGTYINMEGPQFSTLAESNLYRGWSMDIIGMTNATEAKLAREAEICYATLASATDYDCWRETGESVTVEMILDNLTKNVANSKWIISKVIPHIPQEQKCSCKDALQYAIVTSADSIPKEVKEKLKIIIGKYIK